MRKVRIEVRGVAVALCAAASLSLIACSGSSNNNTGTGGHDAGAGGAVDGGGKGGAAGKGMGGAGMGGAGGMASVACGQPVYSHVSPFGAILDGWVVASNSTPMTLAPVLLPDGGLASGTKVEIDKTDGSPGSTPLGSVKLTIPFDQPNEEMLFAQNSQGLNMKGQTITAWIKLDSGLNTDAVNTGKAFLILKTTAVYNYVAGPMVPLDSSAGWVQLSINADSPQASPPTGYDPCDVREIDVSVQTGAIGNYTTAVVHIDTITVGGPGGTVDAGDDSGATDAGTPADAGGGTDAPADTGSDSATGDDAATDVPAAG